MIYDLYETVGTFDSWNVSDTKFISYEDIDFFSLKGSLRHELSVSGGGLNLDGALLGGFLFGGVGALLGSKVGTEISSNTKTIDDRFVFIRSKKLTKDIVIAIGDDIDEILIGLREAIPEKEYQSERGFNGKNKRRKTSD